eukprot:2368891-Rhodomonas_salina.3
MSLNRPESRCLVRCMDSSGSEVDGFHDSPVLASFFDPPSLNGPGNFIIPFQGQVLQIVLDRPSRMQRLSDLAITLDKNGVRGQPTSLAIVSASQESLTLEIGFPPTTTADQVVVTILPTPVRPSSNSMWFHSLSELLWSTELSAMFCLKPDLLCDMNPQLAHNVTFHLCAAGGYTSRTVCGPVQSFLHSPVPERSSAYRVR